MRLTKFLGRKCKVCMRILLLKSLFLGTNCPSFLPILCGILFVFAVDSFLSWIPFVSAVDLFLPWNPFCFCRGFVLPWMPLCIFLLPFCFCLFFSRSFNFLPRNPKNVGVFWEKVHRFSENLHLWGTERSVSLRICENHR